MLQKATFPGGASPLALLNKHYSHALYKFLAEFKTRETFVKTVSWLYKLTVMTSEEDI